MSPVLLKWSWDCSVQWAEGKERREKEIDKNSWIWLVCMLHFMLDITTINMGNEPGNERNKGD